MADRAYFYALGKRKTARATVKLFPEGHGEIMVGGMKLSDWADDREMIQKIYLPLEILGFKKDFDFEIRVSGGGKRAQAEAIQLGIARALLRKSADYKPQLKEEGLLTRDSRVKERKKPGLKRARRAPQFSKR